MKEVFMLDLIVAFGSYLLVVAIRFVVINFLCVRKPLPTQAVRG